MGCRPPAGHVPALGLGESFEDCGDVGPQGGDVALQSQDLDGEQACQGESEADHPAADAVRIAGAPVGEVGCTFGSVRRIHYGHPGRVPRGVSIRGAGGELCRRGAGRGLNLPITYFIVR